jgi:hypothetical protein
MTPNRILDRRMKVRRRWDGLWARPPLSHQEAEGLSASGACGLCVLVIVMPEIISARWG